MRSFVTVSSPFYPQLEALFRGWIAEYLASKCPPDEAANDDADEDGEDDEVMDDWW